MDDRTLKLIPDPTALDAAAGFAPAAEGAPAPSPGQAPLDYLEALASGGHFVDAEGFLAAALPRPEAVRWACHCVRSALGPKPSEGAELALRAAEAWAAAPVDVNRRRAMPEAEAVGFGHPAGCVALAAFLSGGSLVPPELEEVPPPGNAFARAVAGSLLLAASKAGPREIVETHRRFLGLGLAIARGERPWEPTT